MSADTTAITDTANNVQYHVVELAPEATDPYASDVNLTCLCTFQEHAEALKYAHMRLLDLALRNNYLAISDVTSLTGWEFKHDHTQLYTTYCSKICIRTPHDHCYLHLTNHKCGPTPRTFGKSVHSANLLILHVPCGKETLNITPAAASSSKH